jgi:hypothetical protein
MNILQDGMSRTFKSFRIEQDKHEYSVVCAPLCVHGFVNMCDECASTDASCGKPG